MIFNCKLLNYFRSKMQENVYFWIVATRKITCKYQDVHRWVLAWTVIMNTSHIISAISGETLLLPCQTAGSDHSVSWVFQLAFLTLQSTMIVRYGKVLDDPGNQLATQFNPHGNHSLFIWNATTRNNGIYRCTDKDGVGAHIVSYNVSIEGTKSYCRGKFFRKYPGCSPRIEFWKLLMLSFCSAY